MPQCGSARCAVSGRHISGSARPWNLCRTSRVLTRKSRERRVNAMSLAAPPVHEKDPQAFPELDDADLAVIRGLAIQCSFEDGQPIFRAGDADLDLFVVEAGAIEILNAADGD